MSWILTTKLEKPQPRPNMILRPKLVRKIQRGINGGSRLVLLSAPAGFGKTSLLAEWAEQTPTRLAWLTIDQGDNDISRFIQHISAAIGQAIGSEMEALQDVLGSPKLPETEVLATLIINELSTLDDKLCLVLDELQYIDNKEIWDFFGFLLNNQPKDFHLVLSSREKLKLSLIRLRVSGRLVEIRDKDLRLTSKEIEKFLQETMHLRISKNLTETLAERTEGWIAGLQLYGLAIQNDGEESAALKKSFTPNDRYIIDYIVYEVIEHQPKQIRDFIRKTAVLEKFSAELAGAVANRKDAAETIEALVDNNLFVEPIDREQEWFRYHRLFAEAVTSTTSEQEQQKSHQRAIKWLEKNDEYFQAMDHALAVTQLTGSHTDLVRLLENAAETAVEDGKLSTLKTWLEQIDEDVLAANLRLLVYKGWTAAFTGSVDEALECIQLGKAALEIDKKSKHSSGMLAALESFVAILYLAEYERGIELAEQALPGLKQERPHWNMIALWVMAEAQERTTDNNQAIHTLQQARKVSPTGISKFFAPAIDKFLATALNNQGNREEALRVCQQSIRKFQDQQGRVSPVASLLISELAELYYEANQLEEAIQNHRQAIQLSEQVQLEGSMIYSYGAIIPTLAARNETDEALEYLEKGYRLAKETHISEKNYFTTMRAWLNIRQGKIDKALEWAHKEKLSPRDQPSYLSVEQQIMYARLLLRTGKSADTRQMLHRLSEFTESYGLNRWLITCKVLLALAYAQEKNQTQAIDALSQAVLMAAPQQYLRAFIDEGAGLYSLLAPVHDLSPEFVDAITTALKDQRTPGDEHHLQPIVEPLSQREMEVLNLIAQGCSNRKIAENLVITVGTVKQHLNHIYRKLDVRSRTQAIAKANQLDLL